MLSWGLFGWLVWIFALGSGINRVDDEKGMETGVAVPTSIYTWVVQEVESRGLLDPGR